MITVLAGGVGAARFLEGLTKIISAEELSVIVNTGDDIELYGLHISPDLDTITYTLAGIVDNETGWGLKQDAFNCLKMLGKYGLETWFKLGDKDLAMHIYRTCLLRNGFRLSEVTRKVCQALGVKARLLPMTDDEFETVVVTDRGEMHFQEYFVKRNAADKVVNVRFKGVENARPAPGVLDSILDCEAVIISPSNPIVSIGTILSVRDVRKTLKKTKAKVVAISPIVGGAPIKGPADKLMRGLGLEVSAFSVARLYRDFLDTFVMDLMDEAQRFCIEGLGETAVVTNTIMKGIPDRVNLAKIVLNALERG
jgi:LPPG:FO 2-phospho-L-lactate transferase